MVIKPAGMEKSVLKEVRFTPQSLEVTFLLLQLKGFLSIMDSRYLLKVCSSFSEAFRVQNTLLPLMEEVTVSSASL